MAAPDIAQIRKQLTQWEDQYEKSNNLPKGALRALRFIETSDSDAYYLDPAKYHNPKIGTASGLYGILDSTGRDPGWGIKAVDKSSLEDNIRFAAQYLSARTRNAPDFYTGLKNYGDGTQSYVDKYKKLMGEAPAAQMPGLTEAQKRLQAHSSPANGTPIPNHPNYYVEPPALPDAPTQPTRNAWNVFQEQYQMRREAQPTNQNNLWGMTAAAMGAMSDRVASMQQHNQDMAAQAPMNNTPTFGQNLLRSFSNWQKNNRITWGQ